MEIHQESLHCRADCGQERELGDRVSQQRPIEEALEYPGRQIQGMSSQLWHSGSKLSTFYRTKKPVTPTAAWSPQCSPKWRNTSTPSTFPAGNHHLPPLRPMSPVQIWQITPTFVPSLPILQFRKLTPPDHRPQQSLPPLHGPALPRPQAARRTRYHKIES
jgi:hypothetical protein